MRLLLSAILLATAVTAQGQRVSSPLASVVDVAAAQKTLGSTKDPLLQAAIRSVKSCVRMQVVAAPPNPIEIPHHYLVGSGGATNPAEAAATRVYQAFEDRITAGMNQYLVTGSQTEAACALAQLDTWAQGHALQEYDPKTSSQAWYQVEWTLSAANITDSVLVNDAALDQAQQRRVNAWLNSATHRLISFERPGELGNNHHYWRALAAIAIGVTTKDDALFRLGTDTYKEAISQLDANGALPREIERGDRATHYQAFALQPLVLIAEFAEPQQVDLYAYTAHGHTLRDAIVFLGRAIADPSIIRQYTPEPQMADFGGDNFAPYNFYIARFGTAGLPQSLLDGLRRPTTATRLGGCSNILAAR